MDKVSKKKYKNVKIKFVSLEKKQKNSWNAYCMVKKTRVNSPRLLKRERESENNVRKYPNNVRKYPNNVRKYPNNSRNCKFRRSVKNDCNYLVHGGCSKKTSFYKNWSLAPKSKLIFTIFVKISDFVHLGIFTQ